MHTEYIILGSGISGLSTSYFLEKLDVSSIILDINNPLSGSGSTMKSAGIISHFFPFKEEIDLVSTSLQFYEKIIDETSSNISYNNSGLLAFYEHSDQEPLQRFLDAMKSANIDYSLLDSKELQDRYPMISISPNETTIFSKNSGYYNIEQLFPLILKQLANKQTKFLYNVQITNIEHQNLFKFHTNQGTFTSNNIIIAGGAWSNQIANMFNCKINFDTYSTQATIMSSSNSSTSLSSLPIIYKTKSGVYGRAISSSSFLFGDGSKKYYNNPANFISQTDKKFLDDISQHANNFFPNQNLIHTEKNWSGLFTSSQDSRPVLGKLDRNIFFLGCYNGLGIMLAPGCSKLLVDYIVDNKIHDNFSLFDIQRFNK
tara:strand:+ start:3930 stop:5045 length:1116 start_codon:yes stop_codon:yes gene_type:complete